MSVLSDLLCRLPPAVRDVEGNTCIVEGVSAALPRRLLAIDTALDDRRRLQLDEPVTGVEITARVGASTSASVPKPIDVDGCIS